jgi:ABC-type amino acid transport substrate-binding protein
MRIILLLITVTIAGLTFSYATETDTTSRLDRVKNTKVVRVCIWPDYFSISYRNPKTQKLAGIDIDMAKELGKDIGVVVEFVDSCRIS